MTAITIRRVRWRDLTGPKPWMFASDAPTRENDIVAATSLLFVVALVISISFVPLFMYPFDVGSGPSKVQFSLHLRGRLTVFLTTLVAVVLLTASSVS